nr:SPOR domain-containing protein [uncultured Prevotella sp.]
MKKLTVLSVGMCAVLALASCGTSKESAYKKAYEKAQQQEAQQAAEAPVATEPVVTPLETTTPSESTTTEVDNATVRQENVSLVSGSGLQAYSVVVGSFSLKANAEGLASTLKSAGYDSQVVFNSERNMYRVVASTFADKTGAVKSRNQLRAGKYPDAWLLLKK